MRVLLVPNTAASMVWFRLPFLRALRARGHRAWVLAPEGQGVDRILQTGASFLPLFTSQGWSHGTEVERSSYLSIAGDAETVAAVHRACRAVRPDVVLAYTHKMTLLATPAARLAGVRSVHGMITGLGFAHLGGDLRRVLLREGYHASLRVASRFCDSVVLLNPDNLADARRLALAPASKLFAIDGEGVDVDHWNAAAPRPERGRLLFLQVARLVWHKGIATFVEAARRAKARFPDARFVLAGAADPKHPDAVPEATLAAWRAEGVVELPGFVDDMKALYRDADVVVLPSHATEGLPMSLLEAMAMRRPVLVSDVPGNRETVEDGVNGWSFPLDDAGALAGHMQRLLDTPALVPTLGEASRARVEARFDAEVVNARLLAHLGL